MGRADVTIALSASLADESGGCAPQPLANAGGVKLGGQTADLRDGARGNPVSTVGSTVPRRFGEIQRSLGDVHAPVLTVRLRELAAAGLLTRKMYPEIPPRVEYRLTARGQALRPAITALRRWGARAP